LDRGQVFGVLPVHELYEPLLGGERHLGIVLFLLSQGGVATILVVVAGVDEQLFRQAIEGVIERVVLPRGVAAR
jgi:hypothetical protein